MSGAKGFLAYPSGPPLVGQTIEAAIKGLIDRFGLRHCKTWRETDIAGSFIAQRVLEDIDAHDVLIADITRLNFNVTYEVGYAIGKGKKLLLIRQSALSEGVDQVSQLGIFDTLGYKEYTSSEDLLTILRSLDDIRPFQFINASLNRKAPVYLLEALHKTDQVTRIIARVKKARLFYRSFDPQEQPRLSAFEAVSNVAQSCGVLVHLIPASFQDSRLHNLWAAFIAGLATGMGKLLLFLQDGDEPVPLDYRDLVEPFTHPEQIDDAIAEFAPKVAEVLQASVDAPVSIPRSLLEQISLGASSAENELRDLANYYLEVDAFQRAKRGEIRIVVGRKGSGKTALFAQVRDDVRRQRTNVVLDLKPEGYKLHKFKEAVLDFLAEGTVEHTLTAFWEYLLFLEICRKLLEADKERHNRDSRLYEAYRRLADAYESDEFVAEGDFSERMSSLLNHIQQDYRANYSNENRVRLSEPEVTRLIYKHDLPKLRDSVVEYMHFKDSLWLLFDNLDKGWATHGIQPEDLIIIRCLLEATRKIERELSRRDVDTHTLVFLRNDVFELLVKETVDRGKEAQVGLDWTDPDLLKELIRRRLLFNSDTNDLEFDQIWRLVCVSHVNGEDSFHYLIDRSLMRPRCLIDVIKHCRGCAVNLGHEKIQVDDIRKGISLFSTDLIRDIGLEIQDVFPECQDILYGLIDAPIRLGTDALQKLFDPFNLSAVQIERLFDILIWFGVIGIVLPDGEVEYIYDVNYDMRFLQARITKMRESGVMYAINPAFWPGLGIKG